VKRRGDLRRGCGGGVSPIVCVRLFSVLHLLWHASLGVSGVGGHASGLLSILGVGGQSRGEARAFLCMIVGPLDSIVLPILLPPFQN